MNTLITFLGKPQDSDGKKYMYRNAKYYFRAADFQEDSVYDVPYFADALIKMFGEQKKKIDRLIVVGTDTSGWHDILVYMKEQYAGEKASDDFFVESEELYEKRVTEEKIYEYSGFLNDENLMFEPVIVPHGTKTSEISDMLHRLNQIEFRDNEMLYLDITHSYRSIPFLSTFFIDYILLKYPKVEIKDILYGMLEAIHMPEFNGKAPVVSLKYLIHFKQLLRGAQLFLKSGDPEELAGFVEKMHKGDFYDKLINYSITHDFAYFVNYKDKADALLNSFNTDKSYSIPSEIMILKEPFNRHLKKSNADNVHSQFELAKEYFRSHLYGNSIRILYEAMISYYCEKCYEQWNVELYEREIVRQEINNILKGNSCEDNPKHVHVYRTIKADILKDKSFYKKLRDVRNVAAHCGMTEDVVIDNNRFSVENMPKIIGELISESNRVFINKRS